MDAFDIDYDFDNDENAHIKNNTELEGVEIDDVDPDNCWVDSYDVNHVINDVNTQSQKEITWDIEYNWT